jgi:hypothetical protein
MQQDFFLLFFLKILVLPFDQNGGLRPHIRPYVLMSTGCHNIERSVLIIKGLRYDHLFLKTVKLIYFLHF